MSEQHYDVTNTLETVDALVEINLLIADVFKDGWQSAEDIAKITAKVQDPAFQEAMKKAKEDIALVKSELGDLDVAEGITLGVNALTGVLKIIEAWG